MAESNNEIFMAVRRKIREAVEAGALDPAREELVQGTLLQLMAECERKKQQHEAAAARLMEQYHRELGQRDGMTALSSMIQGLLQATILRAQRDQIEAKEAEAEKKEREATTNVPSTPEVEATASAPNKKSRGR